MSLAHHNPTKPTGNTQSAGTGVQDGTTARLAHELANLLDGSLRNLSLAISSLGTSQKPSDKLVKRLESTNIAMHQMAELIHRWMSAPKSQTTLYHQRRTLAETVDHAVRLLSPATALHQIDIHVELTPDAAALASGPVYPVVANALRNSIEALSHSPAGEDVEPSTIEIAAQVSDNAVELTITDNGPGLDASLTDQAERCTFGTSTKPTGHGLGLLLCHDIAMELGGHIELKNRSPRGAVFTFHYPVKKVLE